MNPIYLDANSTTPLDPRVIQTMQQCQSAGYVNPASQHQPGQRARRKLELAREQIAATLGARSADSLIFTSGGTESNNLALIGLSGGLDGRGHSVVISAVEHPSVLGAAAFLESRGYRVRRLPVDHQGRARVETLEDYLDTDTRLVSLMLVNNETGVIQDVGEAARVCQKHGIPLHCDAVQAIGKIPVNFRELGVSALTLTAHKLHGPRGIGGLLIREEVELTPILFGGFQQLGRRPGTEDVCLAVGFATAVELAVGGLPTHSRYLREFRDQFEQRIRESLPTTVINGVAAERAPHTSNLSFPGDDRLPTINRQALMMAADLAGVAISTGSACASGSSEPSHVLTAMGCPEDVIESSIRVSLSFQTTAAEIAQAADRIISIVKQLRQQKSTRK